MRFLTLYLAYNYKHLQKVNSWHTWNSFDTVYFQYGNEYFNFLFIMCLSCTNLEHLRDTKVDRVYIIVDFRLQKQVSQNKIGAFGEL